MKDSEKVKENLKNYVENLIWKIVYAELGVKFIKYSLHRNRSDNKNNNSVAMATV